MTSGGVVVALDSAAVFRPVSVEVSFHSNECFRDDVKGTIESAELEMDICGLVHP